MMIKKIKVSKLDAAKRQLETAVKLYFNDADPISIHTLVMASHEILSSLSKKMGTPPMMISDIFIREERRTEFNKMIFEAKNFFKHANKDPEGVIDFNPLVNELFLLDSIIKYEELTSEKVDYFTIFKGWYSVVHPDILKYPYREGLLEKTKETYGHNKLSFFTEMMSASGIILE